MIFLSAPNAGAAKRHRGTRRLSISMSALTLLGSGCLCQLTEAARELMEQGACLPGDGRAPASWPAAERLTGDGGWPPDRPERPASMRA